MTAVRSRVRVRRQLAASPAKVFGAFADPKLVARWLSPSPEVKLTVLDFDFRVGGSYRFAYDVPTGMRMIVGGIYRTIAAPTTIVFTWLIEPPDEHAGIESHVTVSITASSGGSQLVIDHDGFGRADAEARHEEGWGGALDQLAALVAFTEESTS